MSASPLLCKSLELPLLSLEFASKEQSFFWFGVIIPDHFQRNVFCLLAHLTLIDEAFNVKELNKVHL